MSSMQIYRVKPGYEVRLGPGITFQASPEDVAGALRAGAIELVQEAAQAAPDEQADPVAEQAGKKSKEGA